LRLAEALRRVGDEVRPQVYQGAGHGGRAFTRPASWRMIEDFFDGQLGLKKKHTPQ
jgi:dipeptidyl aminopeptidase/acylaminoacyl peptidase